MKFHAKSFIPVEEKTYQVTLVNVTPGEFTTFEVKDVETGKYYLFRTYSKNENNQDILAGQLLTAYNIDKEFDSFTAVLKEIAKHKDVVVKLQVTTKTNDYSDGTSKTFANPVFIA